MEFNNIYAGQGLDFRFQQFKYELKLNLWAQVNKTLISFFRKQTQELTIKIFISKHQTNHFI